MPADFPPSTSTCFRGRIGPAPKSGFYPAPHRYHLYLSAGCPDSTRVSLTLGLLGPHDSVSATRLTPASTPEDLAGLWAAYASTQRHYDGPLTVPVLCDRWSGRVVSNHTPDILDDLAVHLAPPENAAPENGDAENGDAANGDAPRLRPAHLAPAIDSLRELLAGGAPDAVLDELDGRLSRSPYVLGDRLTAADVDAWAALVHLDAEGRRRTAGREHLRLYVRRLSAHPAFRDEVPGDDRLPAGRERPGPRALAC